MLSHPGNRNELGVRRKGFSILNPSRLALSLFTFFYRGGNLPNVRPQLLESEVLPSHRLPWFQDNGGEIDTREGDGSDLESSL